jgi:hypothetical protein
MATIQNWSKDHVQLIVAYLDPIDIVFLARACPRLARLLKGHLLPRLAQKIDRHFRQHFGIEYYDEFVAMMRRTETCVSGSFVLQMLLLVEGKVGSDRTSIYSPLRLTERLNRNITISSARCKATV